jgi:16S rRNA (cytosine1402-N4)-methyltransferase
MNDVHHFPVLKEEIINQILPFVDQKTFFVDCTTGLAGHSLEIIKILKNFSYVVLIDRDEKSLELALKRIKDNFSEDYFSKNNIVLEKFNLPFSKIGEILNNFKDALNSSFFIVLADLGLSYFQIKNYQGFSFNNDCFLDMRYDKNSDQTAYDVVNKFEDQELIEIFDIVFQNIRFSKKIVSEIVKQRKFKEIRSTFDLNKVILKVVSHKFLKDTLQKVYLALRIFVNKEIEELESLLNFFDSYNYPFLLLIISYHSLEGKVIKSFLKTKKLEFKKIKPSKEEVKINKPSRSAILWVIKS